MFEINSFIRTPGGEFVRVEAWGMRPEDPDYVEGAIEILVDGREIIGKREWDYVDQLWSYIATMMKDLRGQGVASSYYPDQPVKIEFARHASRVVIAATVGKLVRRADVDLLEFEAVVGAAGEAFFQRMTELLPENADAYCLARSELIGG